MAKKTRAQRKKQNLSAQRQVKQKVVEQEEIVVAGEVDEPSSVTVSASVEEPAKAVQAQAKPQPKPAKSDFDVPMRTEKEEKEFQKRVERARKATAKAEKKKAKAGKERKPRWFWSIVDFFSGVKQEMKRTTWPTRNEVLKMSVVVVCALVFFGVLIFIVDSIANPLFYWLSGLGA
ncbi:MAG: preprotein translocase subunit SecE [bacterium]|nr:preprotein translocase subunit SecE [bacterium]